MFFQFFRYRLWKGDDTLTTFGFGFGDDKPAFEGYDLVTDIDCMVDHITIFDMNAQDFPFPETAIH